MKVIPGEWVTGFVTAVTLLHPCGEMPSHVQRGRCAETTIRLWVVRPARAL